MATIYLVKQSPGKGSGVFAVKAIKPGDMIMRHSVKMKLKRGAKDVSDEQVEKAFDTLSKKDQAAFMQLHEGHVRYQTRLMRIYKANAFSGDLHSFIYLNFSRLNHSCIPNAEVTELDDEKDTKLVAVKPIAKGEEVFISYLGISQEGSREQRNQVTRGGYGFECECPTCKLTGMDAVVSDGRRQLINAMGFKRQGWQPAKPELLSNINGVVAGKQPVIVGSYRRKLQTPLTVGEKVAYGFLTAKLLEAEGLATALTPNAYVEAVASLLGQLQETGFILVLPSAQFVVDWTEAALKAMKKVRRSDSKDMKDLLQFRERIQKESEHLRTAKAYAELRSIFIQDTKMNPAKIFAIDCERKLLLTQEECAELFKEGKLGRNSGHSIEKLMPLLQAATRMI